MNSHTGPGRQLAPPYELRYLAELTNAYMAGLRDVIEVLKGADTERLATLLDHLQVTITQPGYVGTVRAISHELARLLGERPD